MPSARRTLGHWLPAILVATAIYLLSTQGFGESHTSKVILPILRRILPSASAHALQLMHVGIRKLAHFTEYSVFSILVFRALRADRKGWRPRWALMTLLVSFGYASLDEIHQAFVPGRGPAVHDVAIDMLGASLAQGMVWWRAIRKQPFVPEPQQHPS